MNETTTPQPPTGPSQRPSFEPPSYAGTSFPGAGDTQQQPTTPTPSQAAMNQPPSHQSPPNQPPQSQPPGSQPPAGHPPLTPMPGGPPPQGPRRGIAALVLVAVTAGLLGGGAGAAATYAAFDDGGSAPVSSLDQPTAKGENTSVKGAGDVQEVAKKVLPSTVYVQAKTSQGVASGSGFIISSDGRILTNNHVVSEGGSQAELSVTFSNGKTAKAKIVGLDPITDLAVIKAEGVKDLKPATLGTSSDVAVGQSVIAIGSPLGLTGTVTSGIVSSLHRPVNTGTAQVDGANTSTVMDAIQTDAAINHGNSGGALVNAAGHVVGINTAIATAPGEGGSNSGGSIGIGFAIPIDQAKPIAEQLTKEGKAEHAQLNVSVSPAQQGGSSAGASLAAVNKGGAADEAGLRKGDVVTKIGDRVIQDSDGLIAAVRAYRPNEKVEITYLRDGKEHTTTVTLDSDGGKSGAVEAPGSGQENGPQQQQPGPQEQQPQPEDPGEGFPFPR